jgi:hypothetical protein
MAIEDDSDVARQPVPIETVDEISLVEAVKDTKSHGGSLSWYRSRRRRPDLGLGHSTFLSWSRLPIF